MRIVRTFLFLAICLKAGLPVHGETFALAQTIPLPQVEGRIDHLALDATGKRLFVAALGNNSVEVIDLKAGKVARSLGGLDEPQGVFFVAGLNRLFIANGGDGTLRVFDGTTFAAMATVKFSGDADNVRYDESNRQIYVGYGGGALGIIDAANNALVADIPLRAHPESFQLEPGGTRIFVNVPGAHHVAVVDREQRKTIATWSIGFAAANFPMAIDGAGHRLFIGCRAPARLLVFDTESGTEVDKLELHGDCDDVFFDPARHQIYASCGEGRLDVFALSGSGHYERTESVATAKNARTCLFDGRQIYLAVPKGNARNAEIRIYDAH